MKSLARISKIDDHTTSFAYAKTIANLQPIQETSSSRVTQRVSENGSSTFRSLRCLPRLSCATRNPRNFHWLSSAPATSWLKTHERPPQCLGTCPPPYDDRDHLQPDYPSLTYLQHQNTWAIYQLQPESPEMHSRFQGLGAYDQYRPQPSAHEPRLRYPRLLGALDNAERTSLDGTETSSLDASESETDASEASNLEASDSEASDSESGESESGASTSSSSESSVLYPAHKVNRRSQPRHVTYYGTRAGRNPRYD